MMEKFKFLIIKTKYAWIASKILVILVLIGSLYGDINKPNGIFSIQVLFMLFILILLTSLILDLIEAYIPLFLRIVASLSFFIPTIMVLSINDKKPILSIVLGVWFFYKEYQN